MPWCKDWRLGGYLSPKLKCSGLGGAVGFGAESERAPPGYCHGLFLPRKSSDSWASLACALQERASSRHALASDLNPASTSTSTCRTCLSNQELFWMLVSVLDAGQLQSLAYCSDQVMLAVSLGAVRALSCTEAYVKHAFVGMLLLLAE